MTDFIENALQRLREVVGASNDTELADKLGVHKSTISSWKTRGSIPSRYLEVLEAGTSPTMHTPPANWGTWHDFAFGLSLLRFSNAVRPLNDARDYKQIVSSYMAGGAFFQIMFQAEAQLNALRRDDGYNLQTAFAMAIHEYLGNLEANMQSDRELLREYGFDCPK